MRKVSKSCKRNAGEKVWDTRARDTCVDGVETIYEDIAARVSDAYVKSFAAAELEDLCDSEGRKLFTYIVPVKLALYRVVALHQNLKSLQLQERQQFKRTDEDGEGARAPAPAAENQRDELYE